MSPTVRCLISLLLTWLALSQPGYAQTAPTAQWASSWGTPGDDRHSLVAVDGASNTYSAGWTQPASAVAPSGSIRLAMQIREPITFGSQTFVPAGRDDALCLGFSPQGRYQWGVQLGSANTSIFGGDRPQAVAADADGNSYFLVRLYGMLTIAQSNNLTDAQQFLVCFSPTGAVRWSRSMPQQCWAASIAVISPDQLQLSGEVYYPLSLDGYRLTCQGTADTFTARLGGSTPTTPAVFIPNVITPNGDGLNDTFAPRNLPGNGWQLSVYSCWGRQVYLTDHYQQDWAATDLPAGLYYHRLQAAGRAPYQGWIEVVRYLRRWTNYAATTLLYLLRYSSGDTPVIFLKMLRKAFVSE